MATQPGDGDPRIGLRFNVHQGYENMLDSFTFPLHPNDALELGALLIAHSDALSGRPVRDWDALSAN
ncbi:hypothetical protein [Mycobacterium sp. SA01]|uniref:hypothetical protein n=1 Tax=Mycobacterium sp. SA01 TaxID=3238820 RepID=UPI00351ACB76